MSKGIKALKILHEEILIEDTQQDLYNLCINDIKKELQALEIIKNKNVYIPYLKATFCVQDYNANIQQEQDMFNDFNLLTKQEYDLLKEVFL